MQCPTPMSAYVVSLVVLIWRGTSPSDINYLSLGLSVPKPVKTSQEKMRIPQTIHRRHVVNIRNADLAKKASRNLSKAMCRSIKEIWCIPHMHFEVNSLSVACVMPEPTNDLPRASRATNNIGRCPWDQTVHTCKAGCSFRRINLMSAILLLRTNVYISIVSAFWTGLENDRRPCPCWQPI